MTDTVEREVVVPAERETVWEALLADGWLAEQVELDLRPGGDATFSTDGAIKTGWVEEVSAPARLAFWWAQDGEPATRVELVLEPDGVRATRVRVIESRPLELLDLVGTPLRHPGGATFGPALVAA